MLWSLNQDTGKIAFILRSRLWMCAEIEKSFSLLLLRLPWVLTTSFNLDWHLSATPFQYSCRENLFMGSQKSQTVCKGMIEHMLSSGHSQCTGLRNLTYEFWWGTIQSIQWIIKKRRLGPLSVSACRFFGELLLWGEFTPSTSNVASLWAESHSWRGTKWSP